MRIQHWQDVASLLVGVWLVLSPFALDFAGAAILDNRCPLNCHVLLPIKTSGPPGRALREWEVFPPDSASVPLSRG
jgi:hypothetical protein